MRYAQMPDEPPESTMTDSMSSSDNDMSDTDDGEADREKRIKVLQEQVRVAGKQRLTDERVVTREGVRNHQTITLEHARVVLCARVSTCVYAESKML